jgi:integrase
VTSVEAGRQGNGRSTIYPGKDGRWHGRVTMGVKDDGTPDRRHVGSNSRAEVVSKVRRLEQRRDAGTKEKAGKAPTLASWMRTWLTTIAPRTASDETIMSTYRPKVERWIVPRLGRHRIDRLQPEHLDAFYLALREDGLSSKTVLMVHQIISRALKMALRRGIIGRNVATLVDAPTHRDTEVEPLTAVDARRVLAAVARMRNGARWSVALALGLRQCEALGMRWSCLDLEAGSLRVFQLKRIRYRHGCDDPNACGSARHRSTCRPGCANHAQYCPTRLGGEWVFREPKGGRARTVAVPPPLLGALKQQHKRQVAERLRAGEAWEDWGLVFAKPDGRPVDPHDDWEEWKRICASVGVRAARVHDARHTAATLALEQGVDIRVVQVILGHSTLATTKRYTHVTDRLTKDAATRVARALWPTETKTETTRVTGPRTLTIANSEHAGQHGARNGSRTRTAARASEV